MDWCAPASLAGALLLVELLLVERKYGAFGGGFGASHVVDTPAELALVLAAAALAQLLFVGLAWLIVRALHRKRGDTPLMLMNFLFFTGALGMALLAIKYEVLRYFSDAIGFQLIKNLGGGSLFDAFLFVLDEAGLLALATGGAALAYLALRWLVKRRFGDRQIAAGPRWRDLLWLLLPLVPLAYAANGVPDARFALARFNAFGTANWLFHEATDVDRDGYSYFSAQRDSWPFDGTRHPFALDVPGNGVDEDGIGGDFIFSSPPRAEAAVRLPAQKRHLILIVLESVRADALGRRVGGVEVTPNLNALVRVGSQVSEAYSHVGFTTASLKNLFTGRLEPAPGGPSLFHDLKANGYRIGVISGQPESFGDISATVGMAENADTFVDAETLKDERASAFAAKGSLLIDGQKLLREFDHRLGAGWERPTFLYLNLQEAHFPYHHPEMKQLLPGAPIARSDISAANKARVAATYWNAVAYGDWLIGQLIVRLKRLGVYEDSLIVVTADHGESLFDDDFLGHGHVINRQQTQIPLVFSDPAVRQEGPVGLTDYRSLLLSALGANRAPNAPREVFQYIGELDRPNAIGMVKKGGVWTALTLETGELWFSDSGKRLRLEQLAEGSPEQARALRLANRWARERWLAHRKR